MTPDKFAERRFRSGLGVAQQQLCVICHVEYSY
jgi:hypothetical protein